MSIQNHHKPKIKPNMEGLILVTAQIAYFWRTIKWI